MKLASGLSIHHNLPPFDIRIDYCGILRGVREHSSGKVGDVKDEPTDLGLSENDWHQPVSDGNVFNSFSLQKTQFDYNEPFDSLSVRQ